MPAAPLQSPQGDNASWVMSKFPQVSPGLYSQQITSTAGCQGAVDAFADFDFQIQTRVFLFNS